MRRAENRVLLAVLVAFALLDASGAAAAVLTRGPYLQMGSPTGAVVRWRTDVATESRVRYGLVPTSLSGVADGPAGVTDHSVTLSGLSPDTVYYYSVGTSTQTLAYSGPRSRPGSGSSGMPEQPTPVPRRSATRT